MIIQYQIAGTHPDYEILIQPGEAQALLSRILLIGK